MFERPKQTGRYLGTERRKDMGRRGTRREEFRFEPGRTDRRNGHHRRKHSGWGETTVFS